MKRYIPKKQRPIFYVYEHWRPDKDVCFWVGKGHEGRAFTFVRNRYYNFVVKKLHELGLEVEVRTVELGLTDAVALKLEISRIAYWRSLGIKLANLTDGGEGASGLVRTDENKLKSREAKLGTTLSEETKRKIGLKKKGQTHTEETKQYIAYTSTGRFHTEETKKKIGDPKRGVPRSEEVKLKISLTKAETRWINNGVIETVIGKGEVPPTSWKFGRLKDPFITASRMRGKRWVTNGIENKVISESQDLESGWRFGISKPKHKNCWINNGMQNKLLALNAPLPIGWQYGHIKK